MVTVPRPPPMAEVQREREKIGTAWRGLVPDPEASIRRFHDEPLRFAINDGPQLCRNEHWRKWKSNGVRPEGYDLVDVWRDPKTKRFAKAPARARRRKDGRTKGSGA